MKDPRAATLDPSLQGSRAAASIRTFRAGPAILCLFLSLSCTSKSVHTSARTGILRDAGAQAGLNYRWSHGDQSPLNIQQTLGHGCAFLDYDQDGLLDILLVGEHHAHLYHNLGSGRFQDVTAESGITAAGDLFGVAVGDYDNDGFPDVYLTGYGICALYHNEGRDRKSGSGPLFRDVTAKAGVGAAGPYDLASAAAFVDLDGDGLLDLFVGRYIVFTPDTPHLCTFNGVRAGCGVQSYEPAPPRVYRNMGNGRFRDMTQKWGFGAVRGKILGLAVRAADSGPGVELYAACDELP
ncbi:MAG TPA: VCBS repeat-containing protein, partial [Chthonomonadales bacterium]|nr:VCBS repeat-containing protein [Chthonomonadales bacterium]